MPLYIKNTVYNLQLFRELKCWVYNFSDQKTILECSSETNLKCQNCLVCLVEKISKRDDLVSVTSYYALLCHSETEGGYVNPHFRPELLTDSNFLVWGNLTRLKIEVKDLHKHLNDMPKHIQKIFCQFYFDVVTSTDILEFKLTNE